ncbi:MAG TPA: enoyl-CoA hydratase/isomerase family protein [Alphaproteobacteria bacterium]|nr:enoyl-CoA hydratase/isomerase family protein [Alphaproteobacteria bacterium]
MEFVDYRVEDHIAHVVMDRPPVNALSRELVRDILEGYRLAKDDPDVRCVMLESALPKVFCAGMDLDMMRGGDSQRIRNYLDKLYMDMHLAQYRMGKPTVAVVNGPARAAGVTVAVSCDCVIASDRASFGYPEIDVGVIPAMHFVHLPRQIGRHKAFELCFNGKPIDAETAERWNLINRVVPHDELKDQALALAKDFAAKSPQIMRLARDSFMRANDYEYRRNIENVVETICLIMEQPDALEGLDAFAEKRKPVWQADRKKD